MAHLTLVSMMYRCYVQPVIRVLSQYLCESWSTVYRVALWLYWVVQHILNSGGTLNIIVILLCTQLCRSIWGETLTYTLAEVSPWIWYLDFDAETPWLHTSLTWVDLQKRETHVKENCFRIKDTVYFKENYMDDIIILFVFILWKWNMKIDNYHYGDEFLARNTVWNPRQKHISEKPKPSRIG